MSRHLGFLVMVMMLVGDPASWAGGGGSPMGSLVYDPSNHAENAITAANAVRQTAQEVQAYTLQVQQYVAQIRNLQTLPASVLGQVLQPYTDAIATAQSLSQVLNTTQNQLQNLQGAFTQQFRQMVAMGLTPSQYLDREYQMAQSRGQAISSVFQNEVGMLQSINASYGRIQSLQSQIPASSGLQQSFQMVNEHLNLLAGQNAQLISLMASHQANDSARLQDENQANAMAGEILQKRKQDEAARVQALHQQLRTQESIQGWGILSQ